MKLASLTLLSLALALSTDAARAADDPHLNAAYQDHIAYVATVGLPVLIE